MFTPAMRNKSFISNRPWLWPLAVAAMIFWASSHSRVAMPDLGLANFDKVAHFSIYGLLATLTARLGRNRRAAWLALLAVSAFGVTDEWHQSFVPGRSCEVLDWVADTLGAALAVGCYVGWERYRRLLELPLARERRGVENCAPTARVANR